MRTVAKSVLGLMMLGAVVAGTTAPAQAHVSVSIGVGVRAPIWYGPPGPCAAYPYYYGAPWATCGYPVWNEPVFIGGAWYHGPFYYREWHGQRWFWWHGAWHVNEWHGAPGAWRFSVHWGDHDYWRDGHWVHRGWYGGRWRR